MVLDVFSAWFEIQSMLLVPVVTLQQKKKHIKEKKAAHETSSACI